MELEFFRSHCWLPLFSVVFSFSCELDRLVGHRKTSICSIDIIIVVTKSPLALRRARVSNRTHRRLPTSSWVHRHHIRHRTHRSLVMESHSYPSSARVQVLRPPRPWHPTAAGSVRSSVRACGLLTAAKRAFAWKERAGGRRASLCGRLSILAVVWA